LKGNTDLSLLDASGNTLVQSAKRARKGERTVRVLAAGTYYLKVELGADASASPFKLNVATKALSKRELASLLG
jgi:hypothetical protein